MKLYVCSHCGNIITYLENSGVPVMCCGEKMKELAPNTVDAAKEKHLPVIEVKDLLATVSVGSVTHPMQEDHYIKWIILETTEGFKVKTLNYTDAPVAIFSLIDGEEVISAYEFCNKHGVWKA
ncbi:MAG: desulfoferrodoxin [Clostridia bacterium]|nr:desulfoferrodoxin [Clostridia bacterium]